MFLNTFIRVHRQEAEHPALGSSFNFFSHTWFWWTHFLLLFLEEDHKILSDLSSKGGNEMKT